MRFITSRYLTFTSQDENILRMILIPYDFLTIKWHFFIARFGKILCNFIKVLMY